MTPPESTSRLQRAHHYLEQGLLDDALAEAYSLVTIAPDNRDGWWFIAQHSPYAGPKREALQRVLAIDPHFHPAHAIAIQMGLLAGPPDDLPTMQATVPPLPEARDPLPEMRDAPLTPPSPGLSPIQDAPVEGHHAEPVAEDVPPSYETPPPAPPELRVRYEAAPATPPPQAYPPEPTPPPVAPPNAVDPIQPFLVVNGGCSSGCFAGGLTLLVMAILLILLVWGGINTALHNINALDQSQSIPADLLPAVAVTGLLAFLQANVTGLPFGLEATLTNAGIPAPTGSEFYGSTLRDLWTSLGYPANTADAIMLEVGRVWPRLTAAPWIPLVIFFFGWLILAFLFVFLRARSRRFLHWVLSTIGLWVLVVVAVGLALLLFTLVYGGA